MIAVLEKTAARLERDCDVQALSDNEYKTAMLVAVTGIFLILAVLLAALVMAASKQTPWEES